MIPVYIFFFFFFFNDPAPTEISPFPLHAALPIGWRRLCPCDRRTVFQHDDGDDDACKSKDLCNAPGQLVPLLVFFDEPSLSDRGQAIFAREYRDRKSTRLNSSHDQISYAVFCLKK